MTGFCFEKFSLTKNIFRQINTSDLFSKTFVVCFHEIFAEMRERFSVISTLCFVRYISIDHRCNVNPEMKLIFREFNCTAR